MTSYIHLYQDLLSSFGDSAHLVHGIPHYGHLQPLQAQVSIVCAHCPKIIWISHIKTKPVTSGTGATENSTVLYSICTYSSDVHSYCIPTIASVPAVTGSVFMGRFILFLPQYGRSSHFAKIYKFRFFPHSVPLRFPFGSSSVPIRFLFGSHSFPIRFPFGSHSVPIRFPFGSPSVPLKNLYLFLTSVFLYYNLLQFIIREVFWLLADLLTKW